MTIDLPLITNIALGLVAGIALWGLIRVIFGVIVVGLEFRSDGERDLVKDALTALCIAVAVVVVVAVVVALGLLR